MISYQEETTVSPGRKLECSDVKPVIKKPFTDSPIYGAGKKVDLRANKQQDLNKTMVESFTSSAWKIGQDSPYRRGQNQSTQITIKNAKL